MLALLVPAAPLVLPAAAAVAEPALWCDRVDEHVWSGTVAVPAGAVVPTGLTIAPPEPGAVLRVVGVSADGLDPEARAWPLDVSVGGRLAEQGGTLDGGTVELHGRPEVDLTVSGVTVVVERCALVEVGEPPLPPAPDTTAPPPDTTAATPPPSLPADASTSTAAPVAAFGPTPVPNVPGGELPATGSPASRTSAVAAASIGLGAVAAAIARRRGAHC